MPKKNNTHTFCTEIVATMEHNKINENKKNKNGLIISFCFFFLHYLRIHKYDKKDSFSFLYAPSSRDFLCLIQKQRKNKILVLYKCMILFAYLIVPFVVIFLNALDE